MEIEDEARPDKYFARGSISFEAVPKSRKRRYFIGCLAVLAIIIVVILLFILLHKSHQQPELSFYRDSPLREFSRNGGAVCSDGIECSIIGRNILKRTGSAVDAAIASAFCNGLYTAQSMGIGGGFQAIYYKKETKEVVSLNAREVAPSGATIDMFKGNPEKSKTGGLSCGVPGELKGYLDLHNKYGSNVTWKELIEPTYNLCMNGYKLSRHQYDSVFLRYNEVKTDPYLYEMLFDANGKVKPVGTVIHHPNNTFCITLRRLMEEGPDTFYTSSLADDFVADVKDAGGIITKEDLMKYRTEMVAPISAELSSRYTVHSSHLPGSGILLAFILKVLDGYGIKPDDVATLQKRIDLTQRIVEVFKHGFAFRTRLGDTDTLEIKQLQQKLLSDEYAQEIRERIFLNKTSNVTADYGNGAVFFNTEDHGTSQISILAPNGDAISLTSTVNIFFGAATVGKRTGILLNSGMDDFSTDGYNNYFGLPPSPANVISPGKSALSSMTPTILVNNDGTVRLVIGAAGGPKITTSTAYVILRHLWLKEDIKKATDEKRVHHQLIPMHVEYERGFSQDILEGLKKLGHVVEEFNNRGSVMCSVSNLGNKLSANADFRKDGDVCGFDSLDAAIDEDSC